MLVSAAFSPVKKLATSIDNKRTSSRHSFSIEMASKEHVQKVSVSDSLEGGVIFEGELGELVCIELVEGIMLQISGDNGTIRIDISKDELMRGLKTKN